MKKLSKGEAEAGIFAAKVHRLLLELSRMGKAGAGGDVIDGHSLNEDFQYIADAPAVILLTDDEYQSRVEAAAARWGVDLGIKDIDDAFKQEGGEG